MTVPGMSPRNGGGLLQEQELLWDTLSGMLSQVSQWIASSTQVFLLGKS